MVSAPVATDDFAKSPSELPPPPDAPGTFDDVPKLFSDRIEVCFVWLASAPLDVPPPPDPLDPLEPPEPAPAVPLGPSERRVRLGAASCRACSTGISYTTPEGLSASGSLGTP